MFLGKGEKRTKIRKLFCFFSIFFLFLFIFQSHPFKNFCFFFSFHFTISFYFLLPFSDVSFQEEFIYSILLSLLFLVIFFHSFRAKNPFYDMHSKSSSTALLLSKRFGANGLSQRVRQIG